MQLRGLELIRRRASDLRLKTPPRRTVRGMKTNINPNKGERARSVGLVHECAALVWTGRWGYSSATTLAALTTKHVPARLVRANLLKRTPIRNPLAAAAYGLTLTGAGQRRAALLLQRVRTDSVLKDLAIARGFRALLLDRSSPPSTPQRIRLWTFNHDVRLQQCVASYMRKYGDEVGQNLSFGFVAESMRTTKELENGVRRPGSRIADFKMSGTEKVDERIIGRRDAFIELENSRKRQDEIDRFCIAWKDRIENSTAKLLVICSSETLRKAWEKAFKRSEVPVYKKTTTGRYAKIKDRLKPLGVDVRADTCRITVVHAAWDVIKDMIEKPEPRARKG